MATLHDFLLSGGVKGRVFRGVVGGKTRSYTPIDFNYVRIDPKDPNMIEASFLVNLVGNDIPKRIVARREEQARQREALQAHNLGFIASIVFNFDYNIPLDRHYKDIYVGDLKAESGGN